MAISWGGELQATNEMIAASGKLLPAPKPWNYYTASYYQSYAVDGKVQFIYEKNLTYRYSWWRGDVIQELHNIPGYYGNQYISWLLPTDYKGGDISIVGMPIMGYGITDDDDDDWTCGARLGVPCPFDPSGTIKLTMRAEFNYVYNYNIEDQSFLDRAASWLDKLTLAGVHDYINRGFKESDSTHTQEKRLKLKPAAFGIRGSIEFDGKVMYTASPSVLAYDITLPDAPILDIPIAFLKNNIGATVDVFFNDQQLLSVTGDGFNLDEITTIEVDIEQFRGQSGELSIVLNTTGDESAEAFIAESLVTDDVTVTNYSPVPVPEPETYALMLAGLGLVGFAARRRSVRIAP